MASPRAACVSRDSGVRGVVGEALASAGLTVDHHDAVPAELGDLALLVVDRATREAAGARLREPGLPPVVVVADDLDDDGLITLMLETRVSHLVEDPSDKDLAITSEKLLSGDLFGLEKYVAAGAVVGERVVTGEADKRTAMAEVCAWAESRGARRPVVHRLASVVDELLMNALRECSDAHGTALAVLRWAADATHLAISVGDGVGGIQRRDIIDNVRRARSEHGRPLATDAGGAGIGLYLVLANVASLIVNIDPGRRTEVVCVFDLAARERRAVGRARSLHVFQTAS
jgi:hypothetical protein